MSQHSTKSDPRQDLSIAHSAYVELPLPARRPGRSSSGFQGRPHSAVRSCSIISPSPCLPASTQMPKNASSMSSSADSIGSGSSTYALMRNGKVLAGIRFRGMLGTWWLLLWLATPLRTTRKAKEPPLSTLQINLFWDIPGRCPRRESVVQQSPPNPPSLSRKPRDCLYPHP